MDQAGRGETKDGETEKADKTDETETTPKEKEPAITRLTSKKVPSASQKLLKLVEKSLDDDKAEDVAVIPLAGKTDIADFMVVATGTSQRHIGAMAQHLHERLKNAVVGRTRIEGDGAADWVLFDAGDVIVHLFRAETRAFYAIEKLWAEPAPGSARATRKSARGASR